MRLLVLLVALLVITGSSSAQFQVFQIAGLEGQDYSFRITTSADYTNHIDTSMLITVEGNEELSFAVTSTGPNTTLGVWISGIQQTSVINSIDIGKLHNSGFNASSDPTREASVEPFNSTLGNPANYSDFLQIQPVQFNSGKPLNTTFSDNSSVISPFLSIPLKFFAIDSVSLIESYKQYFESIIPSMTSILEIQAEVSGGQNSVQFSISGTMEDYHQFTYHSEENFLNEDFNEIEINGGVSLQYNGPVLSAYSETYEIVYQGIRLLQYGKSVNVRAGSGGNIIIGESPLNEFQWPLIIFGGVAVIFLTRYLTKRFG